MVKLVLSGAELEVGSDDKTQYLLFLGNREIDKLSGVCAKHWDELAAIAAANAAPTQGDSTPRRRKSAGKEAIPKEVRDATLQVFDGGKAADLALFGRMLADLPDKNIEAASQVAHAISTNRISMELDYYTALDDLKPEDTAGADMIGTVGFNSACFYRYANVDMGQLKRNLQGDEELAQQTLEAFIRASVNAIPTGKQNSMAAHNPPSFVLAVVRRSSLWNLANAFLKPVAPYAGEDLALRSIKALDSYWGKLNGSVRRRRHRREVVRLVGRGRRRQPQDQRCALGRRACRERLGQGWGVDYEHTVDAPGRTDAVMGDAKSVHHERYRPRAVQERSDRPSMRCHRPREI